MACSTGSSSTWRVPKASTRPSDPSRGSGRPLTNAPTSASQASYIEALSIAEGGEALPPHLSDSALEHLVHLARGLNRNGAEAHRTTHVEEHQAATVSPTTAENIKRLRVARSKAIGCIIGRLETGLRASREPL